MAAVLGLESPDGGCGYVPGACLQCLGCPMAATGLLLGGASFWGGWLRGLLGLKETYSWCQPASEWGCVPTWLAA